MKMECFNFSYGSSGIEYLRLIKEPTPIKKLNRLSKLLKKEVYSKLESHTHSLYGGNKVRNMKFILADFIKQRNKKSVVTLAPVGSNFSAALSSQCHELGIQCKLIQFDVHDNLQILAHHFFCRKVGAKFSTHAGFFGPVAALGETTKHYLSDKLFNSEEYLVSPGGSCLVGVVAHTKAFIEFYHQAQKGEAPLPEAIILGAGTCGTIAGILAAITLLALQIKVYGVRCAEKLVCYPRKIQSLHDAAVSLLSGKTTTMKLTTKRLEIIEVNIENKYGFEIQTAGDIMRFFDEEEGLRLDTTYTSKVGHVLLNQAFAEQRLLYWHTYSDKAFYWDSHSIERFLGKAHTPITFCEGRLRHTNKNDITYASKAQIP